MPKLKDHKTIKQALEYVNRKPHWPSEKLIDRLEMPIWEMIARNLYDHALYPDRKNQASINRSTRAQRIILDRQTGTRRQGTRPAAPSGTKTRILDMTSANMPSPEGASDE